MVLFNYHLSKSPINKQLKTFLITVAEGTRFIDHCAMKVYDLIS